MRCSYRAFFLSGTALAHHKATTELYILAQQVWKFNSLLNLTMEDPAGDDEKKPFDSLGAQNEEDSQPDPDEHIMLESGQGRVWLVKVCSSPTHPASTSRSLADPQIPHGSLVQIRRRGRATGQDPNIRRPARR